MITILAGIMQIFLYFTLHACIIPQPCHNIPVRIKAVVHFIAGQYRNRQDYLFNAVALEKRYCRTSDRLTVCMSAVHAAFQHNTLFPFAQFLI